MIRTNIESTLNRVNYLISASTVTAETPNDCRTVINALSVDIFVNRTLLFFVPISAGSDIRIGAPRLLSTLPLYFPTLIQFYIIILDQSPIKSARSGIL